MDGILQSDDFKKAVRQELMACLVAADREERIKKALADKMEEVSRLHQENRRLERELYLGRPMANS